MDAMMKKKRPGFKVAIALAPKGEEPEGYDEEEPEPEGDDMGDDPEMAMADAGKAVREAFDAKDDAALAHALCELWDMHGEMKEAEEK